MHAIGFASAKGHKYVQVFLLDRLCRPHNQVSYNRFVSRQYHTKSVNIKLHPYLEFTPGTVTNGDEDLRPTKRQKQEPETSPQTSPADQDLEGSDVSDIEMQTEQGSPEPIQRVQMELSILDHPLGSAQDDHQPAIPKIAAPAAGKTDKTDQSIFQRYITWCHCDGLWRFACNTRTSAPGLIMLFRPGAT